jgi:D-beta-D-heptose 7-phosphate kinase/D-beta-D-heptose 1-phosphate adenosyltransferase
VLVDPKGSDFSIYANADIITPNFKEFETIVGPCQNEQAIIDKGRNLLQQFHFKALLITRGEAGMTLITADDATHLPAYAREVFDVTGAGDTVIGTLGAAIAAGAEWLPAVALANLAASITVNKLGAATVSAPELETILTGNVAVNSGIVNDEQLLQAVNAVRAQGKKIVFTNGCFDILHAGHVSYLQTAKQLGDYLIVAVNSDASIKKLKGSSRPINNLEHRMIVLAGLGVVDWVVPFADDTPERLLRLLKPDMLVKGGDYQIDGVVGADIVFAYGGDVRVVSHQPGLSSTNIIKQIQTIAHE